MNIQTVGIYGYGNFGRHVHHLVRRFTKTVEVRVYDPDFSHHNAAFHSPQEVAQCDVVVIAVPFGAFEETLASMVDMSRPDSIIVDVSTIKQHPVRLLQARASDRRYIACHPMFGPESYEQRKGDVSGFRIVICEHHGIEDSDIRLLNMFLRGLGFEVTMMSAVDHDRHLAETLFLTHFVGQIVHRGGFARTEIDTVSFGYLMSAVDSVSKDTRLFEEVYEYLPDECEAVIKRYEAATRRTHELLGRMKAA